MSLVHVVVLLATIFDAFSVPAVVFVPLTHEIGDELVVVVDLALAEAVPRSESPGAAKVTNDDAPLHVVLPAAPAVPAVASCAAPNDKTGTVHKTAPAMSLRNTISLPIFLHEAHGRMGFSPVWGRRLLAHAPTIGGTAWHKLPTNA